MNSIPSIKLGVNPARPRPDYTPNWYNININNISQNAIVVYETELAPGTMKTATGRQAQTLYCLLCAGDKGITAAEVSSWALRLAVYVFKLRQDHGISIATVNEPNTDGIGTHARYVLQTRVKIVEIKNNKRALQ